MTGARIVLSQEPTFQGTVVPLRLTDVQHPDRAPWLTRIVERLSYLCELEPGRDGDQALPIRQELALRVRDFLSSPSMAVIIEPDVVPTQDGGMQIEWHTEDLDVVLAVERDEAPAGYIFDHLAQAEAEGPLAVLAADLGRVWARLAG